MSKGGFKMNNEIEPKEVEAESVTMRAVKFIWICPKCQNEKIEVAAHLYVSCSCSDVEYYVAAIRDC